MIDEPVQFEQALDAQAALSALPTTASAAQLATLPAEIRERALFSARTRYAQHLSRIDDVVTRILSGEIDAGEARRLLRLSLDAVGYDPADIDALPGSLKDLGSFQRLNLVIRMNTEFARGYGNWAATQAPEILDEWPAQELIRVESRREIRDWRARWLQAGGNLYAGRMIAQKNAPIWTAISTFGLPYPPYDYNSGMGVQDIDRDEAVDLGVIDADTRIEPETREFTRGVSATNPVDPTRQSALYSAILTAMGGQVTFSPDGTMALAPEVQP